MTTDFLLIFRHDTSPFIPHSTTPAAVGSDLLNSRVNSQQHNRIFQNLSTSPLTKTQNLPMVSKPISGHLRLVMSISLFHLNCSLTFIIPPALTNKHQRQLNSTRKTTQENIPTRQGTSKTVSSSLRMDSHSHSIFINLQHLNHF